MEQTASGLFVPTGTIQHVAKSDEDVVARTFNAMAKMESFFPQLVKFAIQLTSRIEQLSKSKGLTRYGVLLDVPRWFPNGVVRAAVAYDTEAKRDASNDKASKNFTTLRQVNEDCPQAVDLVMAIAFQLVGVVNHKKIMTNQIKVSQPRFELGDRFLIFNISIQDKPLARPMEASL